MLPKDIENIQLIELTFKFVIKSEKNYNLFSRKIT
jgi:hypothetical protein